MVVRSLLSALLVGVVACDPAVSDVTDDPIVNLVPDITGNYEVDLPDLAGCEAAQAWLSAGLVISARDDAGALTFTFGGLDALQGAVDSTFTWEFSGDVVVDGGVQQVTADGLAYSVAGRWALSGDIDIDASADNADLCYLSGQFEAQQVE